MCNSHGGYTKHYYIEGQRIVSKLGHDLGDASKGQKAGGEGKVNYPDKQEQSREGIVRNLKFLGQDGAILTAGKSGKVPPGQIIGDGSNGGGGKGGGGKGGGKDTENFQYYYHPDHLGSTSYITDASGEVYQHLEYFAFGETFVEEHSNTHRTPFLYNGKELDDETGLYYYGARYYDPRTNVFLSVDPLAEEYIFQTPYAYAANNPIRYVDIMGLGPGDGDKGEKPKIIKRSEWGAKEADKSKGYKKIDGSLKANYNTIVVHHSGNEKNSPSVKDVQDKHMEQGYADIGYHFAIDGEGNIYEGRPLDYEGAHVGDKKNAIGIVLLADLDTENSGLEGWRLVAENVLGDGELTTDMTESLVILVKNLRQEYGMEYLGGHNEFMQNRNCPGNLGLEILESIRRTFKFHKPGK